MKRDDPEVKKDISQPTTFGPPVVASSVTDPAAAKYAQQFAERRGPPKYTQPVAGGPSPPIPRLDSEPSGMLPMADQANSQRLSQTGPFAPKGSLFQGAPAEGQSILAPAPAKPSPTALPPGLQPADLLPEAVRKDPAFRDGQGAMYAVNQPALAYKYGVIRGKQHLLPQQLQSKGGSAAPVGKTSMEEWRTIADLQRGVDPNAAQRAEEDKRITNEAAAGSAGAAGRLGNTKEGPVADGNPAKSIADVAKNMDDFDLNTLREVMMKDIINNEDQRKIIEARCEPLAIDDLITKGFVTQRVPIIPGKFEPIFGSLTGDDDLELKRMIMEESKGVNVSEQYLLDKFSLMTLAAGLYAVNNNPMPDFHDQEGKFDKSMFDKKFHRVVRLPFHMLASIGVNYFWFDIRVRKLFVMESLGNG